MLKIGAAWEGLNEILEDKRLCCRTGNKDDDVGESYSVYYECNQEKYNRIYFNVNK